MVMLIEAALSNLTMVFILLNAVLVGIGISDVEVGKTWRGNRVGCGNFVVLALVLLALTAFVDIWFEVLLWRVIWVSTVAGALQFLWFRFVSHFLLVGTVYGDYLVLTWQVRDRQYRENWHVAWHALKLPESLGNAATVLLLLCGNVAIGYGLAVASGLLFGWGEPWS